MADSSGNNNTNSNNHFRELLKSNQEAMHKMSSRLGDLNKFNSQIEQIHKTTLTQTEIFSSWKDYLAKWRTSVDNLASVQKSQIEQLKDLPQNIVKELTTTQDKSMQQLTTLHKDDVAGYKTGTNKLAARLEEVVIALNGSTVLSQTYHQSQEQNLAKISQDVNQQLLTSQRRQSIMLGLFSLIIIGLIAQTWRLESKLADFQQQLKSQILAPAQSNQSPTPQPSPEPAKSQDKKNKDKDKKQSR